MRTGAQCVVDGLVENGVNTVFGYPGGAVLDIFNVLNRSDLHFILPRHEQGAVHAADGYARASGKVGACLVTSGPGATNTITGLATAHMDGVPLVCICGQVPQHMIGNDAFQEADVTGITRPVSKHNFLVRSADDIPRIMAEAFYIAATGKPGPVVIDIPKDVQRQKTAAVRPGQVHIRSYNPDIVADPDQIAKLAHAINQARRPVLYVGGGVIAGEASAELTALARQSDIPVTTTLMGLGAFPETDPLSLRMLGMHGSYAANMAVQICDLLISVGARFDDRVTGRVDSFASKATIAHIDIDRSAIGKITHAHIPVLGYAKPVLQALLPLVKPAKRTAWRAQVAVWQAEHPAFTYPHTRKELLPQFVIEKIYEVSQGQAVVVTDVGQHQMWSAHFYKYTRPRSFISSGGLGTMGFGLPAAIGAQLARPEALVVAIAGDGGIQMNAQELVVAVEHKLPIKVVIINNGHLGMVRQWQEIFYNRNYSAVVLQQTGRRTGERVSARPQARYLPDFMKLAEAHGANGMRISRPADVVPGLRQAFASPEPWVIECMVSPEANVLPMVPPGASLSDMICKLA
ncbi:MAG: biosynthetic-type acetolactate synthase large subunit [Kiritimatiellia bacterium]